MDDLLGNLDNCFGYFFFSCMILDKLFYIFKFDVFYGEEKWYIYIWFFNFVGL